MATGTINASVGNGRAIKTDATFATARGATDADAAANDFLTIQTNNDGVGAEFNISRGFIPFGSTIPTGATPTAGTIRVYVSSKDDETTGGAIGLIQTTQASSGTIVVADYNNITLNTPDEGATRINIADLNTDAYNDFPLSATGLTWIIAGNNSSFFGMRHSRDIDNTQPGTATTSGKNRIVCNVTADANPPQLTVTYDEIGARSGLQAKYW